MKNKEKIVTVQKKYYGIKISVETSCKIVHARKTKYTQCI